MTYSTTNTYSMKRKIIRFSEKISATLARPERKFLTDMLYGVLASRSCLLSEIAHTLQESTRKINVVDRLSQHLAKGTPQAAQIAYLKLARQMLPSEPIIYIDDSDVIKPEGYHFEALGLVRDGLLLVFEFLRRLRLHGRLRRPEEVLQLAEFLGGVRPELLGPRSSVSGRSSFLHSAYWIAIKQTLAF